MALTGSILRLRPGTFGTVAQLLRFRVVGAVDPPLLPGSAAAPPASPPSAPPVPPDPPPPPIMPSPTATMLLRLRAGSRPNLCLLLCFLSCAVVLIQDVSWICSSSSVSGHINRLYYMAGFIENEHVATDQNGKYQIKSSRECIHRENYIYSRFNARNHARPRDEVQVSPTGGVFELWDPMATLYSAFLEPNTPLKHNPVHV